MPGIYGDLRNIARNSSFEMWNQNTQLTTSGADSSDLWAISVGTSATYICSRASTGMGSGSYCVGITYTQAAGAGTSTFYQVAAMLAEMKGQTISFSAKVATATANACRPWISTDGGTTKTYGNWNSGLGATTFEILKVEGIVVPAAATNVWYGVDLNKTETFLIDQAALTMGSVAETQYAPVFGRSAAWTMTSAATNRAVDMGGTASTSIVQSFGTLIRDLQALGILQ